MDIVNGTVTRRVADWDCGWWQHPEAETESNMNLPYNSVQWTFIQGQGRNWAE